MGEDLEFTEEEMFFAQDRGTDENRQGEILFSCLKGLILSTKEIGEFMQGRNAQFKLNSTVFVFKGLH